MTSDYYSILGVSPAAEDVVIGAAYRALIRHYHPDTNPDPKAQERAREITAAYNVLRDPARRAEYDAGRGVDLWDDEDEPRPPPPMRAVGIGATFLALGIAGAVWFWPRSAAAPQHPPVPAATQKLSSSEPPPGPVVPLRPETERLADLDRATASAPPVIEPDAIPPEMPPETLPPPVLVAHDPASAPRRKPVALATAVPARPQSRPATPVLAPVPAQPRSERVATLDRMARNYFTQSMIYAPDKKDQLQAAQDRSDARRKACRSESCVADAYVRQIRETGAIMESKTGPK